VANHHMRKRCVRWTLVASLTNTLLFHLTIWTAYFKSLGLILQYCVFVTETSDLSEGLHSSGADLFLCPCIHGGAQVLSFT